MKRNLKAKLFFWLDLSYNISTWYVIQRSSWGGPNIYIMSKEHEESIYHMCDRFHFAKEVWILISTHLGGAGNWARDSFRQAFRNHVQAKESLKLCPWQSLDPLAFEEGNYI